MRMNAAWALVIATIVACGVSGCASGKSVSADSTIDTQAIGVHEVKSVQARCRLTLTNAPGKQVTFNGLSLHIPAGTTLVVLGS
jgi:hypothetical protein